MNRATTASKMNSLAHRADAILGLVLWMLLALQPKAAQAQAAEPQAVAPSTYLVQFQANTTEAERLAVIARMGGQQVSWMPGINTAEVKLDAANLGMAASALNGAPVTFIEADAQVTGQHVVGDPDFNDAVKGYGQKLINLKPAWNVTSGVTGTIIAVVDSGLAFNHPEFAGRTAPGYDFVNDDADATDDNGHGTHVGGIIVAGLNGFGMVGVCPDCRIMPVKVLNQNNAGSWSTVVKGILYAVDNGARVINVSLGAAVSTHALESAIAYATEHNVVVVAAAGNAASTDAFYPAALPNVIGVSATNASDELWAHSNYGDYVDVAAPGESIFSCYFTASDPATYAYMSGTSMAAPFVSGLAGLIVSVRPQLTVEQVTALITGNAKDLGAAGQDSEYGFGRIDVYNTMVAANNGVPPIADEDPDDGSNDAEDGNGQAFAAFVFIPLVAAQ